MKQIIILSLIAIFMNGCLVRHLLYDDRYYHGNGYYDGGHSHGHGHGRSHRSRHYR